MSSDGNWGAEGLHEDKLTQCSSGSPFLPSQSPPPHRDGHSPRARGWEVTLVWRAAHHQWLGDEHAAGHGQGQQAQPLLSLRGAEPAPGDTASAPLSVPSGPMTPGSSRAVGRGGRWECCRPARRGHQAP